MAAIYGVAVHSKASWVGLDGAGIAAALWGAFRHMRRFRQGGGGSNPRYPSCRLPDKSLESAAAENDISIEQRTGVFRGATDMTEGNFLPPETVRVTSVASSPSLQGVRYRRVVAVGLDFFLISLMSAAIFIGLFVLSFGMSALLLPPLLPLVAFFYNGLTVSGPRMATPGMAFMDLEVRTMSGAPVEFLQAAVHAVLFYVSWLFPPILIVSLFTHDKRCLHDMLADVIVLRRST